MALMALDLGSLVPPLPPRGGYVTPAVSGIPTAAERGRKSEVAHLWAKWLRQPCRLGDPHRCRAGEEIRSSPLVGKVATSPLPSRGFPPLQSGGGGIRSGPQVGKVATSPLPSRGSPPFQRGGQNQKWPTCGQSGYVTPAASEIPTAAKRRAKSEVAHLWAKWLRHPCRLGDPHRCRAGGQNQKWPTCGQSGYVTRCREGGGIRSGPLVGKVATSPLPSRGSPPLQSGGGGDHLWAKWLRHPCRLGDPHRCRAGGKIRSGPLVGKVATSPLPSRGSPPLQRGGQNQKWPTSGQSGYVTPAVSGIPTAAERGGGNQKWPTCGQSGYVTPAVSGIPTASERGGEIRSSPLVGKVATSPLPSRGSPPLQSGGGGSEVAHLWAKWLCHPCCLGAPHRFRAGGGNQKWPTNGQSGYVTPAVSGIPTAAERGGGGDHLWAKWLRHPCRLGDPHRCRAGGKIRRGPLVGKVATSPLPSRGSPPFQRGGQNQKWPTSGQSGYVTPAVSGIPTAAERGANQKWPTCGQSGYVTPAVSGIPTAAERGGGGG